MKCFRESLHAEYIDYDKFFHQDNVYKTKLHARFSTTRDITNPNKEVFNSLLTPGDYSELHTFLVNMSRLTGLLFNSSENIIKWPGTGFIAKLRRQRNSHCPCPLKHEDEKTEHAIVTISTAYHAFNEESNMQKTRFDEMNEIWGKLETKILLDYNGVDRNLLDLQVNTDLPTLYGYKLIEMDKDLDFDCDWCAIECVTHGIELIERLEKTITEYQRGFVELYKKSQTPRYKDINLVVIIGHPHNWSKKISIGQTRKFEKAPEKEILKEVRTRQTWCRYSYDNVVCHGSSGSPIFKWGQPITGFGYWFGHPHNHSEGNGEINSENKLVLFGTSTIGVENIC